MVPLVRAGWEPDEATRRAALETRRLEDDFIAPMFGGDDEDVHHEARAVRLWVARKIAAAVAGDGPLWPSEIPVEETKVSWQRFFDVAWSEWNAAGVMDRLHEILPARARSTKADAKLALQLLHQDHLRGEARAAAFADALARAPYGEGEIAAIVRMASLSRTKFGWALMKEKRYAEARRVADAVLAESPNDGQVLFFDARLAWLERGDPRAAMERIDAGLERALDDVGRARLMNLYGVALDELKDYPAALEWFQRALRVSELDCVDPDTGKPADPTMTHSILSNLAEIHWKLEQREEARAFAERASRRGSTTEIVKTILAATES